MSALDLVFALVLGVAGALAYAIAEKSLRAAGDRARARGGLDACVAGSAIARAEIRRDLRARLFAALRRGDLRSALSWARLLRAVAKRDRARRGIS